MILVDTSIWADHFNRADAHLIMLNRARKTTIHPFVIGELAAGNLHPWDRAVAALRLFVQAPLIDDDAFYGFIGDHKLMGTGLSFVDLHLLASVRTSGDQLWSRNKRLNEAATRLNCHYTEN